MTTKLEQAARQALEALESCNVGNWSMAFDEFAVVEAITALREALAEQAEQEPVAWHEPGAYSNVTVYKNWANENGWIPLYTRPVRTKDLTDDEIAMCMGKDLWNVYKNEVDFARAVIAADREKNK